MAPAILRIRRGNHLVAYFSTIAVYIDGVNVGGVGNNGTFEASVSTGVHSVHVQWGKCRSPSYQAHFPEGLIVALRCVAPNGAFALFSSIYSPGDFFTLEEIRNYPSG
jgi:hypothetical protein